MRKDDGLSFVLPVFGEWLMGKSIFQCRLQLDTAPDLQEQIDAIDFQRFLPDQHEWSTANDREEARLRSTAAIDPLSQSRDRDVRDAVYRFAGSSILYPIAGIISRLIFHLILLNFLVQVVNCRP